MDVLNQLIKARELITPRKNWTAGILITSGPDPAYCARGAILTAIGLTAGVNSIWSIWCNKFEDLEASEELANDLPKGIPDRCRHCIHPKVGAVVEYNNTQGHEATLAMFDITIARLKREKVVADLLQKAKEVTKIANNEVEHAG
jgi:hypothetical protein